MRKRSWYKNIIQVYSYIHSPFYPLHRMNCIILWTRLRVSSMCLHTHTHTYMYTYGHMHTHTEVLLRCCRDTSGCNKCLLPYGLTYNQCLNITLPRGCPTLNCIERFPLSTSTGEWSHITACMCQSVHCVDLHSTPPHTHTHTPTVLEYALHCFVNHQSLYTLCIND